VLAGTQGYYLGTQGYYLGTQGYYLGTPGYYLELSCCCCRVIAHGVLKELRMGTEGVLIGGAPQGTPAGPEYSRGYSSRYPCRTWVTMWCCCRQHSSSIEKRSRCQRAARVTSRNQRGNADSGIPGSLD
jgi:hypothetical protein